MPMMGRRCGFARPRGHRGIALVALLVLSVACEGGTGAGVGAPGAAPAPPAVVVTEVLRRTVPINSEYVARTVALETVELRARVEGFLEKAPFQEGQLVQKDQVLFVIQPAQYQAALDAARAQLAKARADLQQAREQVDVLRAQAQLDTARAGRLRTQQDVMRYRPLAEQQAIPQQDLDTAVARDLEAQAQVQAAEATLKNVTLNTAIQLDLARAEVQQAEAHVTEAELNLGYTTIRAPIDGIIGVRKVDPGNLVGRGEATLLATMSSTDPFKVEFGVNELDFLRFIERREREGAPIGRPPDLSFELILADNSVYPYRGRPRTLDRALDPSTGTILVEALFPNPRGLLRAGLFGRIRVSVETIPDALLVPQVSVQEVQGSKSVLVVGADDKVSLRSIKTGGRFETFFIVLDGVKAGERVIVEGLQKARPGMVVKPTPAVTAEPASAPRPAARTAGAAAAPARAEGKAAQSGPGPATAGRHAAPASGPAAASAAPGAGPAGAGPAPGPERRVELVLQVLRGDPLEVVAREAGVAVADLERWRIAFVSEGRRGLERAP